MLGCLQLRWDGLYSKAGVFLFLAIFCFVQRGWAIERSERSDSNVLRDGALIYLQRCTLCHGRRGDGEGILAVTLGQTYPISDLRTPSQGRSERDVVTIISEGGIVNKGYFMPPWKDELSVDEIGATSRFVLEIYDKYSSAMAVLDEVESEVTGGDSPTSESDAAGMLRSGEDLYNHYCALCHGAEGLGDGRMARVIRDPPPFNLTRSRVPAGYIKLIVRQGGAALMRSERMPPFGEELSDSELDVLVEHLEALRK